MTSVSEKSSVPAKAPHAESDQQQNPLLLPEKVAENLQIWKFLTEVSLAFVAPFTLKESGPEFGDQEIKIMTQVDVVHGMARMTELFGMCGIHWGYRIGDIQTKNNTAYLLVTLWYKPHVLLPDVPKDYIAEISEFGSATAAGKWYPRSLVSSGLSRCFRALGHASRVYSGLEGFDENKEWSDDLRGIGNPNPQNPEEPHSSDKEQAQADDQTDYAPEADMSELPQETAVETAVETAPPSNETTEKQNTDLQRTTPEILERLFETHPLLQQCEWRLIDDESIVCFLIDEGHQSQKWFISSGFKPSNNYPGRLFMKMQMSWLRKQFIDNDLDEKSAAA